MDYDRIYKAFIADRLQKQTSVSSGSEVHHITPRSLGGDDSPGNLVRLSYGDHVFAHRLLARMHGGGMWSAYFLMINTRDGVVTRREYERVRVALKNHLILERNRQDFKAMVSATAKKVWSDPAYKAKMKVVNSAKMLKLWEDATYREAMSAVRKGAKKPEKFSTAMREVWRRDGYKDRFKAKMDSAWTTKKREAVGAKSRELWKTAEYRDLVTERVKAANSTPEARLRSSLAAKGVFWVNNGFTQKRVLPEDGIPEGFAKGRLPSQNGASLRLAAANYYGATYRTVTKEQIAEYRGLQCS